MAVQNAHLAEMLTFLHDRNPQVRQLAVHSLLPYTAQANALRSIFVPRSSGGIASLKEAPVENPLDDLVKLCEEQDVTAHDALSALINLTNLPQVRQRICTSSFFQFLISTITTPTAILSDLAAMLLSNMTKHEPSIPQILALAMKTCVPLSTIESLSLAEEGTAMDAVVEVFAKGEGKQWNRHANYDFLASVFANFSVIPGGREWLLGLERYPKTPESAPLAQLKAFSEHASPIRRGGRQHDQELLLRPRPTPLLLSPTSLNLLPYIILPLLSPKPTPFPADEEDSLPEECQLMEDNKTREPDEAIRGIWVEALGLLGTSVAGREVLRAKQVYRVVQLLHEVEQDEKILENIERLVNLLERPEGDDTRVEEVDNAGPSSASIPAATAPISTPTNGSDGNDEEEDMTLEEV